MRKLQLAGLLILGIVAGIAIDRGWLAPVANAAPTSDGPAYSSYLVPLAVTYEIPGGSNMRAHEVVDMRSGELWVCGDTKCVDQGRMPFEQIVASPKGN